MNRLLNTLILDLGNKSYPIHIGPGLLEDSELLSKYLKKCRPAIITDANVAELYLDKLRQCIKKSQAVEIIIPAGEEQKNLATLETICTKLLENLITRHDMIIALGGGVVGDLAGFTAASYQRGIQFIQVPTTLLAQVDSSVGGKTGVNHPLGKNMIGAFHQPHAVITDLETLHTLPARQISAGIAEIIKYGLITDADFFGWLQDNIDALKNLEPAVLTYAIRRSCEIKSEIVAQDEYETGNHRVLLNFGHTFGHAIETITRYETWLHGEAIGCGMVLAARLSAECNLITASDVEQITQLIKQAGLPIQMPEDLDPEQLIHLMKKDKKNIAGKQRFVLLKKIGTAYVDEDIPVETLRRLLTGQ